MDLKSLRKQKGLTREKMATQLGVSFSTYGRLERGETQPRIDLVQKLNEILGVDVMPLINRRAS